MVLCVLHNKNKSKIAQAKSYVEKNRDYSNSLNTTLLGIVIEYKGSQYVP